MRMHAWLGSLTSSLESAGLNHVGVLGRARYDAAAPPSLRIDQVHPVAQSIVVAGSGGRAHWEQFLLWVAADPVTRLARTSHPLDDFCQAVIASLPLADCRVIFPSRLGFDFMRLAELAGLGAPSEIGTLVSARFGPWFGLRAAIFTPHILEETVAEPRACDGCHAPCRAACPVSAVGPEFDWRTCVDERVRAGSACRGRCHARLACVVAPEHAYDDLELLYHYDRPAGRRALCAKFAVRDEGQALGS
jgi:hypothetical protein